MSEPLAQALRISGASLIMLTSLESRTTVWSAGRARVGADVAALGAAITEAAAEMVRLTADGIDMDDLLVTSPANFHLLRVVDGQVAHLVLDRGTANLAMARREFRQMVAERSALALSADAPTEDESPPEVEAETPVEVLEAAPVRAIPVQAASPVPAVADQTDPGPTGAPSSEQALEGEVLPASNLDLVQTDRERPRLPQRRADASWQDDAAPYQATVPALPDWLRAAAEGPFMNDAQTLDRLAGGLRRLR
jgi:hypothetical protein